ncbi:MAG: c-type cytochrome [Paracoccaceae bacterium]
MGLKRTIALGLLAATPAWADFDPSDYPPYEICALCHGLYGQSATGRFPNLAGQPRDYLHSQIEAFRAGARHNDGGQMAAIVTEIEEDAIPVVVEWFSTQDPPPPFDTGGSDTGAVQFSELGCDSCHDNSSTQDAHIPYLSAQHPSYLEKQMLDFRENRRINLPVHAAHSRLLAGPDIDPAAIAAYLAAQERP